MEFHIIYTKKDGQVVSENRTFGSFNVAEEWLKSVGAQYWEIGIKDEDLEQ